MPHLASINASLGLLPWHCRLRAEMGVSQATQICLATTHVSTLYKVITVCLLFPMASSCSLAATEDRCTWCLFNLGSLAPSASNQKPAGPAIQLLTASSTAQCWYNTQLRKADRDDPYVVHTLDALWTHCLVLPGPTCLGLPADTGKV